MFTDVFTDPQCELPSLRQVRLSVLQEPHENMWVVGRRAWLVGLVGRAELNGVEVILLNFITKSGRWATQCVVSKEKLAVKESNLEPSASMLDVLSRDSLISVLSRLSLSDLTVVTRVSREVSACAKRVAREAGAVWVV